MQVKALAADSDAAVATLSRLVALLAGGSVAELAALISSDGSALSALGVDAAAALDSKRIVAIAALGGTRTTTSFADVAAAIQVRFTPVERVPVANDYSSFLSSP